VGREGGFVGRQHRAMPGAGGTPRNHTLVSADAAADNHDPVDFYGYFCSFPDHGN